MPIPNRTTAANYHFHIYNYPGSAPFTLSQAIGPNQAPQFQFYSLFQDLQQLLADATAKNIPAVLFPLQPQTIGQRYIWVLRFGGGPANKRVLFTGGVHGRERIAVEIPFLIAEYLINNYPDPNGPAPTPRQLVIQHLVDRRQIFVAPMLNPDGHMYATLTDRNWRINRRILTQANDFTAQNQFALQMAGNIDYFANQHNPPQNLQLNAQGCRVITFHPAAVTQGVDVNRNFPGPNWGYECYRPTDGKRTSSGNPAVAGTERETYFGPKASSEPETQAIVQFITQYGPFLASIDYHSYGKQILYPEAAAGDGDVIRMAQCMSELIRDNLPNNPGNLPGNNYAFSTVSQWLYPAFSTVADYSYQTAPQGLLTRKPYAFTVELDPVVNNVAGSWRFDLPEAQILNVFRKNIRGALALIACAGKFLNPVGTPQCCGQFANWDVYNHGNQVP